MSCECLERCIFFNDKMASMPSIKKITQPMMVRRRLNGAVMSSGINVPQHDLPAPIMSRMPTRGKADEEETTDGHG